MVIGMKYIFLDIDGTLYDHDRHAIPESALEAIRQARNNGHRIFMCTGRPCCMLDHVKDIPYEGVIASAGAYVKAGSHIIYEEYLGKEALKEITDLLLPLRIGYLLEGRDGVYLQPGLLDYFRKGEGRAASGHEFFKQKQIHSTEEYREDEEAVYKLCLYAEGEEFFTMLGKQLPEEYHLVLGKADDTHPYNAELTLKRNNKASGIRRVMEYYHGSMEDTLAIGDSLNDQEMLEECSIGIAMGNADDRLKPYADYVTADIDRNGIYLAFQKFGIVGNGRK